MKTRKLAVFAAVAALFVAGSAFANDFDAPDTSGGNSTAHVDYDDGTRSAPAPEVRQAPTPPPEPEMQTVIIRTFPVPVPVLVPVRHDH